MKIVFVCTGNTCRSPMAEILMKKYIEENNIENVEVSSCGIMCSNGMPISEGSRTALKELGIDNIVHKSNMITMREIIESDYIFTMTVHHRDWLRVNYNAGDNVFALGEFLGMEDVSDPYGGSINDYIRCGEQINYMISKLCDKLFGNLNNSTK